MIASGPVDETIYPAKLADHSPQSLFQLIPFERIALDDCRLSRPGNFRQQGGGLLAIAGEDGNLSAAADQRPDHVATQDARAARHHHRATVEVVHFSQLS
jgi:hypothetical protein